MDYTGIKKLSLSVFLGFLMLTALIAIIAVLRDDFGSIQIKILVSSAAISGASICAMSCVAFIERKHIPVLGFTGVFFAVAAALLLIVAMWGEIDNTDFVRTIMSSYVISVAFAHAFLLVLPDLEKKYSAVQTASSISISFLALMIVAIIWGDFDNEYYFRLMAVTGIIVGLLTLVIPLLMKMRKGETEVGESLVLKMVEPGLFEDSSGTRYEVQEILEDSSDSAEAV